MSNECLTIAMKKSSRGVSNRFMAVSKIFLSNHFWFAEDLKPSSYGITWSTTVKYRVSHIEMNKVNWLGQMDRLRFSISYLKWPIQEVMSFGFYQPDFKKHWLASTASYRKDIRYQWKIGFLMIHSTKRDCYLSFGC